ncbi:hypothetical protein [Flavisolibacter nicotianae]|uniref:hypothetical protein n=1 Tax=Flavisolibacter nicotianae TaxID=2364882 RepID=UPI000EB11067|nr:hypothetical protein [Flavisolibacter nicotianae]
MKKVVGDLLQMTGAIKGRIQIEPAPERRQAGLQSSVASPLQDFETFESEIGRGKSDHSQPCLHNFFVNRLGLNIPDDW